MEPPLYTNGSAGYLMQLSVNILVVTFWWCNMLLLHVFIVFIAK